ncbi:MAG: hypothetical protein K9G39_05725 [Chlorobium sp.]|uniref:hypothetical protein n=1 Tax=Chlorobium sp. TaxID=1095 RepID=UPI0025BE3CAA|nr:hypothetical protein [Chlorobium sp.]MCF8383081.1 hypothetical protein [Chlorobium sp.]
MKQMDEIKDSHQSIHQTHGSPLIAEKAIQVQSIPNRTINVLYWYSLEDLEEVSRSRLTQTIKNRLHPTCLGRISRLGY